MSQQTPCRLALAVEPVLYASMLERVLKGSDREIHVLDGDVDGAEVFDVVIASGKVPSGVAADVTIRLPALLGDVTTGILWRNGSTEIVQIPSIEALRVLIEQVITDAAMRRRAV